MTDFGLMENQYVIYKIPVYEYKPRVRHTANACKIIGSAVFKKADFEGYFTIILTLYSKGREKVLRRKIYDFFQESKEIFKYLKMKALPQANKYCQQLRGLIRRQMLLLQN